MKKRAGFTLIELMIVLAVFGILSLAVYPSVVNVLRVRSLETAARDILMELNQAKMMAVKDKAEVRMLFAQDTNHVWTYILQEEASDGTWSIPDGVISKVIPTDFQVTVNLPDLNVEFCPLGIVQNYAAGQNSISLQSDKLKELNKPDVRSLIVYGGGSVQFQVASTS